MTSLIRNIAREYRNRAEEARAKAEETTDPGSRESLLKVAETWERMATYEERTNEQRHLWEKD